ncbi:MAG: hypothetical protein Q8O76_05375 [Chloroflexota bacterium]|nr:hypothetical protein [Chloroflexota bacterium]
MEAGEPWAVEAAHRGIEAPAPTDEYDKEAAKLDKAIADEEAKQQELIADLDKMVTATPSLYAVQPSTPGRYGDPRYDYYLVKAPEGYVVLTTKYGAKLDLGSAPATGWKFPSHLTSGRGVHVEESAWGAVQYASRDTMRPPKPVGNNKVGKTVSHIVVSAAVVKSHKFARALFDAQWASRQALSRVKGERQKQADTYSLKLGHWTELASWLGPDGAKKIAYVRPLAREELQAAPHWRAWLDHEESQAKHSLPIVFVGTMGGEEIEQVEGKYTKVMQPPPSAILEEASAAGGFEFGVGPISQEGGAVGVLGGPSDLFSGARWGPGDGVKPLHRLAAQAIQEVKEANEHKKWVEAEEAKAAQEAEEIAKAKIGRPANDPSTIKASLLVDVIERLRLYAATTTERPTLACINIQKSRDALDLAAADGFRLAHASLTLETAGNHDWVANIPAKELGKWMSGLPSKVVKNEWAVLDFIPVSDYETFVERNRAGNITKTTVSDVPGLAVDVGDKGQSFKGMLGQFPRYTQLIPSRQSWSIEVRAGGLVDALKETGGLITGKDAGAEVVLVPWSATGLAGDRLLVIGSDHAGENRKAALVPAKLTGDWMGQELNKAQYITFNAKYLTDVVAKTFREQETVSIGLTSESAPGLFSGSMVQDVVVMPLFINLPSREVLNGLVAGAKTIAANPHRNPSLQCPSCQGSIGNPGPGVYHCNGCGATMKVS